MILQKNSKLPSKVIVLFYILTSDECGFMLRSLVPASLALQPTFLSSVFDQSSSLMLKRVTSMLVRNTTRPKVNSSVSKLSQTLPLPTLLCQGIVPEQRYFLVASETSAYHQGFLSSVFWIWALVIDVQGYYIFILAYGCLVACGIRTYILTYIQYLLVRHLFRFFPYFYIEFLSLSFRCS